MIFVDLKGRIGNQLFIYAFTEALRLKRGNDEKIVFFDYKIRCQNWVNSLQFYPIENVEYVHTNSFPLNIKLKKLVLRVLYHFIQNDDYNGLYNLEKKWQKFLSFCGIISCTNGFLEIPDSKRKDIYINGYYQCPKYFHDYNSLIVNIIKLDSVIRNLHNNVETINNRNTVCISIKVEHNVGNSIYDVCGGGFWAKAIKYITERVDNPLFFICSDNVDYVKAHLIDTSKYDVICQDKTLPVHLSLAIMGLCKHFIIGNTSFGWWAQHISTNPNKIVVVPKPWVRVDMPVDIYEEGMHLIDVSEYIE